MINKTKLLQALRTPVIFIQEIRISFISRVKRMMSIVRRKISIFYSRGWFHCYNVQFKLSAITKKWTGRSGFFLFIIFSGVVLWLSPELEPYVFDFADSSHLESLQQLVVTLGASLIGATTIAFSAVMFAMQTNVERMPHSLFKKFGSDLKLLAAFITTFIFSISIAVTSIFIKKIGVSLSLAIVVIATLSVLGLFLYSYRRAIDLVNPYKQLEIIAAQAKADLHKWHTKARRAKPLLVEATTTEKEDEDFGVSIFDQYRLLFFKLNPRWTLSTKAAIENAMSFARRFGERGDPDVAASALNTVVNLNRMYVDAKGNTFVAVNYLANNSESTDEIVNLTLEQFRQYVKLALSRDDERQVSDAFASFAYLVDAYLEIKYATESSSKWHAHLAAGYLGEAVQSAAKSKQPDLLMDGLRRMGYVSQRLLTADCPQAAVTTANKIHLISLAGIAGSEFIPVTITGVEQLATLMKALLQNSSGRDHRYAIHEIRNNISSIAELIMQNVLDAPLSSKHEPALAPYFSSTTPDSFLMFFNNLANAVIKAEGSNVQAKNVAKHLKDWSDTLYDSQKKVLLIAVSKRSTLTFHLFNWVKTVTVALLAVAESKACDKHVAIDLKRNALWLFSIWSWIPDDEVTIRYVETFQISEYLFEISIHAHQRQCEEESDSACKMLLDWGFKSGKYNTGWDSLAKPICGAMTLTLFGIWSEEKLLKEIDLHLKAKNAPQQDLRERASKSIKEAISSYPNQFTSSRIDQSIHQVDRLKLKQLSATITSRLNA